MKLDWKACNRARLSRDARFDGKFFIAVRTSRVYCRPICPAPTVKDQNVLYYPTAAAASEAGFRPCLRCRPECSPGTPAWVGTPSTVARALRLIHDGGLEDGGVEGLAERLGVGSRHLRRLFLQHLGATPSAVAQTRRLHFAKKLIDETRLPMIQIALASGFGCVRRFNHSIRTVYHRTPTQIRRLAHQKGIEPANQYVFKLYFRPPYHWRGMLNFLAARATPGTEVVEGDCYRRTIALNGCDGYFEVSPDSRNEALIARVNFPDSRSLFTITERIRSIFDLNSDWAAIQRCLKADPCLATRVEAVPGLRIPGSWEGFELAVRAILGQQVSVKGATTLAGRIAKTFGRPFAGDHGLTHIFPTAEVFCNADLTKVGLTKARAEAVRGLARAVHAGRIKFDAVGNSEDFLSALCEIPGIGKWTAQYVAMRALGEPDACPSTDLALLRALGLKNARELELRSEAWRPWRAYAVMYLWNVPAAEEPKARKAGQSSGTQQQSVQHLTAAATQ
jgi:AraC family transcriptional regulator, regulatory protein of adaptative response / DNA-3-methyladenine glycosylase II